MTWAGTGLSQSFGAALTPTGTLVLVGGEGGGRWIGGAMGRSVRALVLSPFVSHNLRTVVASAKAADLQFLTELLEAAKVTPVHRQDLSAEPGP